MALAPARGFISLWRFPGTRGALQSEKSAGRLFSASWSKVVRLQRIKIEKKEKTEHGNCVGVGLDCRLPARSSPAALSLSGRQDARQNPLSPPN
jgi:hypothetical protein